MYTQKYRPRKLKQLVGQPGAVSLLAGIVNNEKRPQTYLVYGPYGCGKTTISRILAKRLNCSDPVGADSCNKCPSCTRFRDGNHPDLVEINAASSRGIDDARTLAEQASYAPRYKKRVILLDEAHMLTPQAFKSLLKPLEEPAPNTIFMLITSEDTKIPKEIRSRCSDIVLKKVPTTVLADKLLRVICKVEKVSLPDDILMKVAELSDGRPRNAISNLERVVMSMGCSGSPDLESITKVLEEITASSPVAAAEKYLLLCKRGSKDAFSAFDDVPQLDEFVSICARLLVDAWKNTRPAKFIKAFARMDAATLGMATATMRVAVDKLGYDSTEYTKDVVMAEVTFNLIDLFEQA